MDQILLDDILFRYKHPSHQGQMTGAGVAELGDSNPSCGDEIKLYLRFDNNRIKDACYEGTMCSIANYGAELLLDKIIGMTTDEARGIASADLLPADCSILRNPVRLKCFETAQRALSNLE